MKRRHLTMGVAALSLSWAAGCNTMRSMTPAEEERPQVYYGVDASQSILVVSAQNPTILTFRGKKIEFLKGSETFEVKKLGENLLLVSANPKRDESRHDFTSLVVIVDGKTVIRYNLLVTSLLDGRKG